MVLEQESELLKPLLQETVAMLCRNGLPHKSEISVEGLIGVTVDRETVLLINLGNVYHKRTPPGRLGILGTITPSPDPVPIEPTHEMEVSEARANVSVSRPPRPHSAMPSSSRTSTARPPRPASARPSDGHLSRIQRSPGDRGPHTYESLNLKADLSSDSNSDGDDEVSESEETSWAEAARRRKIDCYSPDPRSRPPPPRRPSSGSRTSSHPNPNDFRSAPQLVVKLDRLDSHALERKSSKSWQNVDLTSPVGSGDKRKKTHTTPASKQRNQKDVQHSSLVDDQDEEQPQKDPSPQPAQAKKKRAYTKKQDNNISSTSIRPDSTKEKERVEEFTPISMSEAPLAVQPLKRTKRKYVRKQYNFTQKKGPRGVASKKHPCPVCPKKFPTEEQLNVHVTSHKAYCQVIEQSRREVQGTSSATTNRETPALPTSSTTNNNKTKTTGRKVMKCTVCHKVFKRMCNLVLHMKMKHNGRQVPVVPKTKKLKSPPVEGLDLQECKVCKKQFRTMWNLRCHSLIHDRGHEKMSQTTKTPKTTPPKKRRKSTKSDSDLLLKVKVPRLNYRHHPCSLCDASYTVRHHLMIHHKKNHPDDPLPPMRRSAHGSPTQQGPAANQGHVANVVIGQGHVTRSATGSSTRSGRRPFMCSVCGVTFVEAERLQKHIRLVHGWSPIDIEGQPNSESVTVKVEPDFDFDGMTTDINMNNQSSGLVVAGVTGNATIDLPPSPSDLDIEYQGQTGVVVPLVKLETSHSSDSEQLSLIVSEGSETESKQAS